MEVTALCISLMVEVLVLLVDHSYFAQKADAALPRVLPDRQQFFEYETVSVVCEEFGGSTEWRVMRKLHQINPKTSYSWNSSAPSCTIYPTFKRHSGEYWCEDAGGNTSDAVNITVTAGSVILEVPARPVKEGDDVILRCKKKTQSEQIADFYKDGSHLGTLYETNLIIQNASKADEGLYRCSISGAGESPQSWLAVLKLSEAADEETRPPLSRSTNPLSLLWVVPGVLVVVLLLLMVMGLLLRREDGEPEVSAARTKPRLPEESVFYSTVYYRHRQLTEGERREDNCKNTRETSHQADGDTSSRTTRDHEEII
ncbi:low affinity immunoglobulin gamma Fc region receptor III-like [Cebidichthys violaceus]|uniref:low affinity immunoglobulin gamma Fc region receptor III-like n=1 Tax=Cebidichthys violaceus TaxID=271503 RepID=UPI0035CBD179